MQIVVLFLAACIEDQRSWLAAHADELGLRNAPRRAVLGSLAGNAQIAGHVDRGVLLRERCAEPADQDQGAHHAVNLGPAGAGCCNAMYQDVSAAPSRSPSSLSSRVPAANSAATPMAREPRFQPRERMK